MAVTSEQHQVYSSSKNYGYNARLTYTAGSGTITVTNIEMAQDSTSHSYSAYYAASQTAKLIIGGTTHNITKTNIAKNTTSWYSAASGSWSGTGTGNTTVTWQCRGRESSPYTLTFSWTIDAGTPTAHVNGYIRNQKTDLTWGDYWHWINEDVAVGSYKSYWGYGNASGPDNTTYNTVHWEGYVNSDTTFYLDAYRRQYTLTYAPNGGSSTPASQTKIAEANISLRGGITRSNSTASGYTVTFNANGGSVSPPSLTATDTISYTFSSWKDGSGTTYSGGGTYTKDQNDTLTAQWSSTTTKGSIILPTPTRANYNFKGWAESASATSGVTGTYTPTKSLILYAIWEIAQATARVKTANGWVQGLVWYKKDANTWVRGQKVYKKTGSSTWTEGIN